MDVAEREKRAVTLSSVIAAVGLTGLKLGVGAVTGSLGLLAEAAHSGLDLVAALITYAAVRISGKPADLHHQYGHAKVENLSAFVEVLLLLVTCGWIVVEAVERLVHPRGVQPTIWAFGVVGVAILVDFSRSRALARAAEKYDSQALAADALHFSTDIWSSAVVLVGLGLVKAGEYSGHPETWARADAGAALIVAVLVLTVSLRLGRQAVDVLLDRAPSGLDHEIVAAVERLEGVLDCGRARVRRAGSQTFVDLNVAVARNLTLEQTHDIAEQVEAAVRQLVPGADVIVHAEPQERAGELLAERVRAVASNHHLDVHHISVHKISDQLYIDLDLEVEGHLNLTQAHELAGQLEAALREDIPDIAEINTRLESRDDHLDYGQDLTSRSSELVQRVEALARETAEVRDCYDVRIHRVHGNLFVSLHCTFEGEWSIEAVHEAASAIEGRLYREIENLERVVVHAEPVKPP